MGRRGARRGRLAEQRPRARAAQQHGRARAHEQRGERHADERERAIAAGLWRGGAARRAWEEEEKERYNESMRARYGNKYLKHQRREKQAAVRNARSKR